MSAELRVGDAVRVMRGVRKIYRDHTFTVREVLGADVRVDNGHPSLAGMQRNGSSVGAWLRRFEVEPWHGEPHLTQSAVLAGRNAELVAEIIRLKDALAAAGVEVPCV